MDTKSEILQDEWIQSHSGMCATCDSEERGFCVSFYSGRYGSRVHNDDSCEDWTEKKGVRA